MITNKNSTASKDQDKKSRRRNQQQRIDDDRQHNIEDENNRNKDNGISQIMWSDVLCHTKYKSSLGYKAI